MLGIIGSFFIPFHVSKSKIDYVKKKCPTISVYVYPYSILMDTKLDFRPRGLSMITVPTYNLAFSEYVFDTFKSLL